METVGGPIGGHWSVPDTRRRVDTHPARAWVEHQRSGGSAVPNQRGVPRAAASRPFDAPLLPAMIPPDERVVAVVPPTPRVVIMTPRQLAADTAAIVDAVVAYLRPGPLHADVTTMGPDRLRAYLGVYAQLPMDELAAPLGVEPAAVATGTELLDLIADNNRLIRLKRARQRLEGMGHDLLAATDGAVRATHPLLPPLGRIVGVTGVAGAIGDSTTAVNLGDSVVREMVRTWVACAIVESTNRLGTPVPRRRARAAERRALTTTYRASIRYNVTLLGIDTRALAIERVRALLAIHDLHGHALDGAWADVINLIYMMEEARRHIAAGHSIPVPVVRFFDELRRTPSRPSRVPLLRTFLRIRHR